ncbi:MAG: ABC transporter substrate-binding protein [Proteobacteria bacterium]|nr:ABC transporter substrate-binding protein [Pseudomonadota bacterium]MBU4297532.1 ABC transporter substrate-binding protein [Pseudomonadota bacterium]MCG2749750.1 ABC transporter substrate-binding protein [Desulfobulbaceae bacterium]
MGILHLYPDLIIIRFVMNKLSVCWQTTAIFMYCLFALLLKADEAACLNSPAEYMQSAVEEIMAIVNTDQLKLPENSQYKRKLILTVLRHHFDFKEMSKLTLGKHWKDITDAEKDHFIEFFSQMIENSYINKIEAYSDEKIIFLKESVRGNKSLVPTVIKRNNLDIPISYKLYKTQDSWRIYDVVIEGVSLVQNYRSQFNSIIMKEKYAGLVRRIDEKVGKIASEGE